MANVLITGADGFIGSNLRLHLSDRKVDKVMCFTRQHRVDQLFEMLQGIDFIYHLAGINRPLHPMEFVTGNVDFTLALCQAVVAVAKATGKLVPVVYASSVQAALDNPYGQSKRTAEQALFALQAQHGVPVHVCRLPNVFGKWARPNYNSVVATFCHNVARGMPITIDNASSPVSLVHVDDVCERFLQLLDGAQPALCPLGFEQVGPVYTSTVGDLACTIEGFAASRQTLLTDRVGTGLIRALYSTYVSYLPVESFAYSVPQHVDPRGVFVEMLKTPDCGQFSYFTAHPGVTRGGHYHHSKTEKFLVIKGEALFKFRHMCSGEAYQLRTSGAKPTVVETVPGWTHDITNIGQDEMVVMLWANEVFDRTRPDTFACPL